MYLNTKELIVTLKNCYPAHITDDGRVETVEEHCKKTAKLSAEFLVKVGLSQTAYLAGLLHDCGKYSEEFKQYILKASNGEKIRKGSVIHSFAGLSKMIEKFHSSDDMYAAISSEIIAYVIGSHHGMFDIFNDKDNISGFTYRKDCQPEYDKKAQKLFSVKCADNETIDDYFIKAKNEVMKIINENTLFTECESYEEKFFYLGELVRLVLSAVADADRTDTAFFMNGYKNKVIKANENLWEKCSQKLDEALKHFSSQTPKKIDVARKELSEECKNSGKYESGIYRLNLPTGAGKTLSSLRFAIEHCKQRDKDRIIIVSPLLSILDQNAHVIKQVIDNKEIIIEHHSDVVNEDLSDEAKENYSFLVDTWDSPIIITTLVQILNTFFKEKMSCVRRFHSLCNSVIIIDEVQTVPAKMLSLFNLTLNFLSKVCNTTILLCSATQPELTKTNHSLIESRKLISDDIINKHSDVFKRSKIIDKGNMNFFEINYFIEEIIAEQNSLLVVCNKKSESEELFEIVKNSEYGNQFTVVHLSASMCMAHRRETLENVKNILNNQGKVICISTQVIEAGVDISFSAVIRLAAGIDSIVQAAGRCNRNGLLKNDSPVYVINLLGENLSKLPDIKASKDSTLNLLYNYRKSPEKFDDDLSSDKAISFYYEGLYSNVSENHQDYPLKNLPTIFSMMSLNEKWYNIENKDYGKYLLPQAFKTAGENFEVFENVQKTVLVPYKDGKEIITELYTKKAANNLIYMKSLISKAKSYCVNIFEYQFNTLVGLKAIRPICDGMIYILDDSFYGETGLILKSITKEDDECSTLIL